MTNYLSLQSDDNHPLLATKQNAACIIPDVTLFYMTMENREKCITLRLSVYLQTALASRPSDVMLTREQLYITRVASR